MAIRTTIDKLIRKFEKDFATHNRIEVSKSALLHNFDLFTTLSGKQVIPVLKGNAYGHGIEQVAAALKDRTFPYIAVDGYFEALRVRKVSRQPVLIMGAIKPENFKHLTYDHFAFIVQDAATIRALGATKKKLKVHLECNTGMNRYGAAPAKLTKLTELILSYPNLQLEGVMSHLADSDGTNTATVEKAVKLYDSCVETIQATGAVPTMFHVAQSAGSLKARSKCANAMRLGIGLYGINPFPPAHPLHGRLSELRPALRFVSTVTKVIPLKKGDQVSYNYTFTAPRNMTIGIIPAGYYEGVNRALSNAGSVSFGESYLPIVGRVCMNHTMLELSDSQVATGNEVTVYSSYSAAKNSIDKIAQENSLFNYNLLTALSPDVRRILTK
jgi:alanine racemase